MHALRSIPGSDRLFPSREWLVEKFAMLCHGKRLDVLRVLTQHPRSVASIAAVLDLDADDISYHLTALRTHGVVTFTAERATRIYELGPRVMAKVDGESKLLTFVLNDGASNSLSVQTSSTPARL